MGILREIPNRAAGITLVNGVTNYSNNDSTIGQLPSVGVISVDWDQGLIFTSSDLEGLLITCSYQGEGAIFLSGQRVFLQQLNGNITQTLADVTSIASQFYITGVYNPSTLYYPYNVVFYLGSSFMCTSQSSGNVPTNQSYFKKIAGNNYLGIYSTGTTYNSGDFVVNSTNDTLYISLVDANLNQALTNTAKWGVLLSVASVISSATSAASAANNAASSATSAASTATTSAGQADTAKNAANSAATSATSAATLANNAASALVSRGTYSSSTNYSINNVVFYQGVSYMCITAGTGNTPSASSTFWNRMTGFVSQGLWNSGITYSVTNVVYDSVNQNLYMSLVDNNLNNALSDTSKWQLLLTISPLILNTKHFGAYNSGTSYVQNNVISYNGSSYMNILACSNVLPTVTSNWQLVGSQGIQGIQGFKGNQWRGAYSGATSYVVDDVVSYNGSSFIAILSSLNNLPTNTTYFSPFALKGADGAGTVAGVTSANSDIAVNGTVSNPILQANTSVSATPNSIVKRDGSGYINEIGILSNSTTSDKTSLINITNEINLRRKDLGFNVKDYNASGSNQSTTGSITTGTNVLTLTSALDFVNGQGININGILEVASLTVTAAPTSAGMVVVSLNGVPFNIPVVIGVAEVASLSVTVGATSSANCTITLNGVSFNVALTSGNTATQVATAIRAATFTGWTTGGTATTVTFTSTTTGSRTDATYSAGTTGATGTMTTTTQGVTADTTTSVATTIRGTTFTNWTTGGSGTTVTFTSTLTGNKTDATYSAGTTAATGTMTTTTQGTADFITTITSGAGTTSLVLASNASTTVSGIIVSHDDTAAILACYNTAKLVNGVIFFPVGNYYVSDSFILDRAVSILGDAMWGHGSEIYTKTNKPIFVLPDSSEGATIEGIAFYGENDIMKTLQDGIYATNVNAVTISRCYFNGLYNSIHVKDTVFYSTVENCIFYTAMNAFFYGEGTSASGYQVTFNHNIAPAHSSKYGFYFDNFGAVTIDDLEFSPTGCTDGGVVFYRPASLAGVSQISHSRLEGSQTNGLQLLGASGNNVKYLSVVNTYIAGTPAAVYAEYCNDITFDTCYFTGDGSTFSTKYVADNIKFSNCQNQVTGVVLTAGTGATSISYDVVNPLYNGSYQFIYLPFLAASVINRISVVGGKIGLHATPIDLPTYDHNKVMIKVVGNNQKEAWITPTLLNGWVNFDAVNYSPAGYYQDNEGMVHLRGLIKSGTASTSTPLFILPAGYRPIITSLFPAASSNGTSIVPFVIEVGNIGNVIIGGSFAAANTWIILNGISFRAEQ